MCCTCAVLLLYSSNYWSPSLQSSIIIIAISSLHLCHSNQFAKQKSLEERLGWVQLSQLMCSIHLAYDPSSICLCLFHASFLLAMPDFSSDYIPLKPAENCSKCSIATWAVLAKAVSICYRKSKQIQGHFLRSTLMCFCKDKCCPEIGIHNSTTGSLATDHMLPPPFYTFGVEEWWWWWI